MSFFEQAKKFRKTIDGRKNERLNEIPVETNDLEKQSINDKLYETYETFKIPKETNDASPKLVSYNHKVRPFKGVERRSMGNTTLYSSGEFEQQVKDAKDEERCALEELKTWNDNQAKEFGLEVKGGNAATISWNLNIKGPNVMDVSPTDIRDGFTNERRDALMTYIRRKIGVNVDGTGNDMFALDWKDGSKRVFNEYRCMFPIYFPGLCIKLNRNGAHITGPTTVDDFLGVAEFVRGFYSLVSQNEKPHYCMSFSISMLNYSVKLGTIDQTVTFPNREVIHRSLFDGIHEACHFERGFMWDNTSTFQRCCVTELDYSPKDQGNVKGYAGVNFRYFVHGVTLPGDDIQMSLKWPWISMFDKGSFLIINHSPNHIIKSIKFVTEFISRLLVTASTASNASSSKSSDANASDADASDANASDANASDANARDASDMALNVDPEGDYMEDDFEDGY